MNRLISIMVEDQARVVLIVKTKSTIFNIFKKELHSIQKSTRIRENNSDTGKIL